MTILNTLSHIESTAAENRVLRAERLQNIGTMGNFYRTQCEHLIHELSRLDIEIKDLEKFFKPASEPSSSETSPTLTPRFIPQELKAVLNQIDLTLQAITSTEEKAVEIAEKACEQYKKLAEQLLEQLQKKKPIDEKEQAIRALEKEIAMTDVSYITGAEREAVIQNLAFFFYEQECKGKMDFKNQKELETAAKNAIAVIDMLIPQDRRPDQPQKVIDSLLKRKNTKLDPAIRTEANRKIDKKSFVGIKSLFGLAEKDFAHFYEKLKSEKKKSNSTTRNYSEFHFTTIPFLAGELYLMERRFKECEQLCESLPTNEAKQLLIRVKEKLNHVGRIKQSFFQLLQKCRVKTT